MPRKPGPPKLPADVIALHGNKSKLSDEELEERRREEAALRPAPIRPSKPAWLSTYASEAWDQHAAQLERLGLLTKIDAGSFALAMETFALARYALEDLRPRTATGTVDRRTKKLTTTEVDRVHGGMLKKHPSVAVFTSAQAAYLRWCVEFGLTPSARMGLRPARSAGAAGRGGAGDDGDGASELLGY
jgi:P27 family predicted phage terminase small subunit